MSIWLLRPCLHFSITRRVQRWAGGEKTHRYQQSCWWRSKVNHLGAVTAHGNTPASNSFLLPYLLSLSLLLFFLGSAALMRSIFWLCLNMHGCSSTCYTILHAQFHFFDESNEDYIDPTFPWFRWGKSYKIRAGGTCLWGWISWLGGGQLGKKQNSLVLDVIGHDIMQGVVVGGDLILFASMYARENL